MSDAENVFDQIDQILTPERVLADPRASGEGIRIGIIDTGVDEKLLKAELERRGQNIYPIQGGVFRRGSSAPLPYQGKQSAPHGTTVAHILLTMAPRAALFSADIFGWHGASDVDLVIQALRWAVNEWRCKVVNLSLGVPENRLQQLQSRHQFLQAIEEAYYKDVIVFAAAHNDHPLIQSYPARFAPALVSVDKGRFETPLQFAYELKERIEFKAHGQGYFGPFVNELATSWATAHLAGIVAKILSLRPCLKPFEVKTILYWLFRGMPPQRQSRVVEGSLLPGGESAL